MTTYKKKFLFLFLLFLNLIVCIPGTAQIIINEGSNRNYTTIPDEDNEYNDWIEIYNNGNSPVNLHGYSLTDDINDTVKWQFPNISIPPGGFKIVFCSGKDRKPLTAFQQVAHITGYTPVIGWNTHTLSTPFLWDGLSNIIINTCSFSNTGYTTNSVFNQTPTTYKSTNYTFVDGSDGSCFGTTGTAVQQRPNMKINGHLIGSGILNNGAYDYPAPYGNWYWSSRHQMLIRADELIAAGVSAGPITTLGFDVASTDPATVYTYLDFSICSSTLSQLTNTFISLNPNLYLHANFSISRSGETIFLFNENHVLSSSLLVDCINPNDSKGSDIDGSSTRAFFNSPTPIASNNNNTIGTAYLQIPVFSRASGLFTAGISVAITNPNTIPSSIRYTTDGSDPSSTSPLYSGTPVQITSSTVLKARAFANGYMSSPLKASSYLIGVNHSTPILSVITDNTNLYGPTGIFDNSDYDWDKDVYAEYFNTDRSLIFSQPAGMQIDGGAGGSRSQPQHSFRLELDHSVLGGGPISYPLFPDKPNRNKYSKLYLRNGSNQFLVYPYKDACGVKGLAKETKTYYSAYRPISVYINGSYFGLYELREKFDPEYFKETEQANEDSVDILSQSFWYNGVLRAVCGSLDSFYTIYNKFIALDPSESDYWEKADKYFDMESYVDYIIAEAFIQNIDWPYNNIKIYRSNASGYRYRFAVIDIELSLQPHGWSSSGDDPIDFLFSHAAGYPYSNIWLKSMQNPRFKNYFINRFADLINTSYQASRLNSIEDSMYREVLDEMPREYARWGDPNNISGQMNDFRNNHLAMQSEFSARGQVVRNFIQTGLGMTDQVNVTLKTEPSEAGRITISTITPGPLPWSGVYFNGNSVGLTALANEGYVFSHWDTNSIVHIIDTAATINLNITEDATFTAVFKKTNDITYPPTTNADHVIIYPIPADRLVNVYLKDVDDGNYQIDIYNSITQLVKKDNIVVSGGRALKTIDISQFSSGVYYLSLIKNNKREDYKFMIIHNK